jgi:hypothetical protein
LDAMKITLASLFVTVSLVWVPNRLAATSFEEFQKIDSDRALELFQSLATKFSRKVENEYPDRKEDIDAYFTTDVSGDGEFEADLEEEVKAYREWAEATGPI